MRLFCSFIMKNPALFKLKKASCFLLFLVVYPLEKGRGYNYNFLEPFLKKTFAMRIDILIRSEHFTLKCFWWIFKQICMYLQSFLLICDCGLIVKLIQQEINLYLKLSFDRKWLLLFQSIPRLWKFTVFSRILLN